MGFLTPFLQDRATTSSLQRGRVPVVEQGPPNGEDGSDEEGGSAAVVPSVAAVLPDPEAGAPAHSASAEAAVGRRRWRKTGQRRQQKAGQRLHYRQQALLKELVGRQQEGEGRRQKAGGRKRRGLKLCVLSGACWR